MEGVAGQGSSEGVGGVAVSCKCCFVSQADDAPLRPLPAQEDPDIDSLVLLERIEVTDSKSCALCCEGRAYVFLVHVQLHGGQAMRVLLHLVQQHSSGASAAFSFDACRVPAP